MNRIPRTIAIGDIHGCSLALHGLFAAIRPTSSDTVVTLGDYVNRGPDSKGVFDLLLEYEGRCRLVPILGNHDETLLEAIVDPRQFENWLAMGGQTTQSSYQSVSHPSELPVAHLEFLGRCLPYFETDRWIFTHANYAPNLPLTSHSGMCLRWLALEPPLPCPHYSGKCVVVGHTPQLGHRILDLSHLKCLDTGMGFDGLLSALDLDSGESWQVDKSGRFV